MKFSNQNAALIDAQCRIALRQLRAQVRVLSKTDPLLRHITNYVVVICSGAIEREFKSIVVDHVTKNAGRHITNYINTMILHSSTNPKIGAIKNVLAKFDMGWDSQYDKLVNQIPGRIAGAVSSLVDDRNNVAHGNPITASFDDVVSYYCRARIVVGKLENVLI